MRAPATLLLLAALALVPVSAAGGAGSSCDSFGGLAEPAKKEIAMQLVSSAENSSLDWRAQYRYIEYNVEGNRAENRGYTGGIIGFTSRTADMLAVVRHYRELDPDNPLAEFVRPLRLVNGTSSRKGLGKPFERAWRKAARSTEFRSAQDRERDRHYFCPAVETGQGDGVGTLGQFIYYDALVMHGPGSSRDSFGGIRRAALELATTPADGGDEYAYLSAFLDERRRAMKREQAHEDTSRVDTAQRVFLEDRNFGLDTPLRWKVYGDSYEIATEPETGSARRLRIENTQGDARMAHGMTR